MRRLSSNWTRFYQYFFVPLWIGLFGLGTLMMFVAPDSFSGNDPREHRSEFLLIWVIATIALTFWFGRLVTVDLRGNDLVIKRFSKVAQVPLRDVESVDASRFSRPERITIRFRSATPFGDKVTFLAPYRTFSFFSHHPLRAELEELVTKSRGKLS